MLWQPGITLDEVEKTVIIDALRFYHGNRTNTASALGIGIRTLQNKINRYKESGIAVPVPSFGVHGAGAKDAEETPGT